MIPRSLPLQQTAPWQQELAKAITDPLELLDMLKIPASRLPVSLAADKGFPMKVTHSFIRRMRSGDLNDPLLKQVLPLAAECEQQPGYSNDPLDENTGMPAPGLLHKYHGRVLLTLTGACAIHCRYCFRRHFPYPQANPMAQHWQASVDYIRENADISEIILSGGDPLSLSDNKLARVVNQLSDIPHLQRLRIHTRQPVVLPSRIDDALLGWLVDTRLKTVIVLHINHAAEIDHELAQACQRLRKATDHLLNQSVLLHSINDSVPTLEALSLKLFETGILPYYLHQLDAVNGAAHFSVNDKKAKSLHKELQARLPGYLLPRLVREFPDMPAKQLL